ncbi:hypothetical protein [Nitrosopumilus sp.]|uniref:hypothetical protein n=1 Tax=Nitrosopumilus sp. TaxID=2024843 RepID=UPI00247BD175|nr:hypothetical protein [Nitrosopumilus sp.]MCV0431140.1 hypothetical protein [Nitrosopumilus sp.]
MNHRKMEMICVHCGKSFEGDREKFCSQGCRDSFIVNIEKRAREAVRNDPSHTSNMSNE